jgi:hypothetical protein
MRTCAISITGPVTEEAGEKKGKHGFPFSFPVVSFVDDKVYTCGCARSRLLCSLFSACR